MKKLMIIIILLYCLPAAIQAQCPDKNNEKSLVITWKRTVCQSKNPCERCLTGPKEVKAAYDKLQSALAKMDITVTLDEQTVKQDEDLILINDKTLDKLLSGKLVERQCVSCPGTDGEIKKYNALELGDKVYEVVPAELIIKAGLISASELFATEPAVPCEIKTPCQGCPSKN